MKKTTRLAGTLIVFLLAVANQTPAQTSDPQKPGPNIQTIKIETIKPAASNAAGPAVVKNLNDLSGDVTLQAGSNITVTPSGNGLIVAAPNTLTSVTTDSTLNGNGTAGNPLRLAAATETATFFSESVGFTISANISLGGASLMTVPAGKRLAIEYASGHCFVSPGQFISFFEISIYSPTLPKRSAQVMVPVAGGSDPAVGNIYVASAPVRFYVDAGYTVEARAWRGSVATGTVPCGFHYSGSLINQP